MIYLLGILVVATRFGRGPSLLASILSVAAFDFIFVPPYFTFVVSDFRHVGTFSVLLLWGWSSGTSLSASGPRPARPGPGSSGPRPSSTWVRNWPAARDPRPWRPLPRKRCPCTSRALGGATPRCPGRLEPPTHPPAFPLGDQEREVAQWVFNHGEAAGLGMATLPDARATYLPLKGSRGSLGVLGVRPHSPTQWLEADQRQLLEAFATQTALALERSLLAEQSTAERQRTDQERLRNALLSSISHDLRTPLGVITGAVSTALETPDISDSTRRDLLISAQEEAQRLHRLVSNLLDITRLEAGALELHTEWIPMEEVVGAALNRRELGSEIARVRTHLPEDLPMIAMDAVLMEQVLVNLIDNALKYSPPGSPVDIKAWAAGKSLTLSVADQGPGIAPGEEARIFEKLVRGEAGASRPGAGLGLAICKGIVAAHGGQIQAVNHPQGGAQFLISLPLGTPPAVPRGGTMTAPRPQVLLVEDEPQMRRFLRVALEGSGYRYLEAATGQEGLALAAQHRPDVILLDLGLPDMDGLDLMARLREWTQTPVIVISARGQEADKVGALDVGADDYLTKPFGTGELLARIRVALRHADPGRPRIPVRPRAVAGGSGQAPGPGRGPGSPPDPARVPALHDPDPPCREGGHPPAAPEGGLGRRRRSPAPLPPRVHGPAPAQAGGGSLPARGTCKPSPAWATG